MDGSRVFARDDECMDHGLGPGMTCGSPPLCAIVFDAHLRACSTPIAHEVGLGDALVGVSVIARYEAIHGLPRFARNDGS